MLASGLFFDPVPLASHFIPQIDDSSYAEEFSIIRNVFGVRLGRTVKLSCKNFVKISGDLLKPHIQQQKDRKCKNDCEEN